MTDTPSTTPVAQPAFDPAHYKATTTDQWQAAAAAWYAWGSVIDTWLRHATEVMLDLAGVGTGSTVLDVGAGAARLAAASHALPDVQVRPLPQCDGEARGGPRGAP